MDNVQDESPRVGAQAAVGAEAAIDAQNDRESGSTPPVRNRPRPTLEDEEDDRIQKWAPLFKTENIKFFTGEYSKDDNLKTTLDTVLDTAQGWFEAARVTSDRGRLFLLTQLLKGRALETVRKHSKALREQAEAEGNPTPLCYPSYKEVVELLKKFTVKTSKGPIQFDKELKRLSLLKLATEGSTILPLVSAFDKMKRMVEKRPVPMDSLSLVSLYLDACPPELQQKVRYITLPNGDVTDPLDPDKLENNIIGYSEDFQALAQRAKQNQSAPVNGGGVNHQKKRRMEDAGPSNSSAWQKKGRKDKGTPRLPKFLSSLPESAKKLNYQKGMHFYVEGLLPAERQQLIAAKKCCLCKELGHMINECPLKEAWYNAKPKKFFAYTPISK